jgi:predicted transcriptional regulator
MKVSDYSVNDVHTLEIDKNLSVLEIASLFLKKEDTNSFIITKNEKAVYIITQTDLIFLFFKGYEDKTLKEIIEEFPKKIFTININQDIYEAYKIMRDAEIEHYIQKYE